MTEGKRGSGIFFEPDNQPFDDALFENRLSGGLRDLADLRRKMITVSLKNSDEFPAAVKDFPQSGNLFHQTCFFDHSVLPEGPYNHGNSIS